MLAHADERAVSRLPRLKQAIFYDGLHDQRRGQALDAGELVRRQLLTHAEQHGFVSSNDGHQELPD